MRWVTIKDYPNYDISDEGLVRNNKTGKIMKTHSYKSKRRRDCVNLHGENGVKQFYVSHLVAEAFVPNPKNHKQIRYLDGDIHKNTACNLEWYTDATRVRCVETGQEYDSLRRAAEENYTVYQNITQAIRTGKRAAGYHWVKVVED